MRRRLLYYKEVEHGPTLSMYEVKIDSFYYQTAGPEDTELSPIFEYHYYPKYTDGSVGDTVYINQLNQNEKSDEIGIRFTLDSSTEAEAKEAGTVLDENTGALTFNKWEEPAASETYRLLATVIMEVRYPNDFDRYPRSSDTRTAEAEQEALQIIWEDPIVNLSYDNAPAQPDEEGEVIQIKPNVTWTQHGSSGDPYTESNSPDAQYIYEKLEGDFEIDNNGVITVDPSTLTYSHSIGRVRVTVTHLNKEGSAECEVFQEAYTPIPEEVTLRTDVLLFDKDTRDNTIVPKGDFDYNDYPKDKYTPVGIVVIPRDHGVYGDNNTIGVLSLIDADMDNPTEGGIHGETIYGSHIVVTDIEDSGYIPYNVENNVISDNYISADEDSVNSIIGPHVTLFPSDMYSGLANTLDNETSYSSEDVKYGAPSPYDNNGELSSIYKSNDPINESYGLTSPFKRFNGDQSTINNLHYCNYVCDEGVDGMKRIGVLKDDSVWRTSSKIDFYDSDDFYTSCSYNYCVIPAMEACWRYTSENTHEGNWHLPSTGEWGYVIARAKAINNTLKVLNSMYGVNYSEIIESGYITCTPYSDKGPDDEVYTICNFDSGFIPTIINKKGIARPIMQLKALTSSGNIGNTPLPNGYDDIAATYFLDDNRHKSRWCIYRNENACNNEHYPSYNSSSSTNCKSGTVYGLLVKSDTDMTILKTDVELFSFDNLTCASGRLNRQFGYYNQDIEAGWYVIQKIVWDDGTTTANIYPPSVVVGNTLQPISVNQDGWLGTVSVIYNYRNEGNLGYDDYTDNTFNSVLSPFRIGYWDNATAILLHSTIGSFTEAPSVYNDGRGNGYGVPREIGYAPMTIPAKTITSSDDSLYDFGDPEYYNRIIAVGEPLILNDGDTVKIQLSIDGYGYSAPVTGSKNIALTLHEMNSGNTVEFSTYELANTNSGDIVDLFGFSGGAINTIECTVQAGNNFGTSRNEGTSRYRLFLRISSYDGDITISKKCTIHMIKE